MIRGQVDWRTLGLMLLTGIPGVVLGTLLFRHAVDLQSDKVWLYLALGSMIAFSSAWHIYRHFRPAKISTDRPQRPAWLAATMLPVGAEVGFSSSGAGALGTIALLSLTRLETTQVVGTDLAFGLCLSLIGGGLHLATGGFDAGLLTRLVAGGLLGAIAGSTLAPRIPARAMRLALSLWLLDHRHSVVLAGQRSGRQLEWLAASYRPSFSRVASRSGSPAWTMRSCASFRLYGTRYQVRTILASS